jgi:hypothetical protein
MWQLRPFTLHNAHTYPSFPDFPQISHSHKPSSVRTTAIESALAYSFQRGEVVCVGGRVIVGKLYRDTGWQPNTEFRSQIKRRYRGFMDFFLGDLLQKYITPNAE